jgi:hypothetical protein
MYVMNTFHYQVGKASYSDDKLGVLLSRWNQCFNDLGVTHW